MKEIVHIQVGQCGNQISQYFWQSIAQEHCINLNGQSTGDYYDQIAQRDVFFHEVTPSKFQARCVLVDLEHSSISQALSGPISNLYNPYQSVTSKDGSSAGNNWGKGFYGEGSDLIEEVLDVVRKQVELTENLQGFQLAHSLGGGTGSGLGCLLLSRLRDDAMLSTFSVFASPKVSDTVIEPYCVELSTQYLIEHTDAVFLIDNEALYDMCSRQLKIKTPNYSNLNSIVGHAMSSLTCSFRFPNQPNSTLQELTTNLIPDARMKFLLPSIAPIQSSEKLSRPEIISQLFSPSNQLAACDPRHGHCVAGTAVIRGQLGTHPIDEKIIITKKDHKTNIKEGYCPVPPPNYLLSGFMLCNNTAIREVFLRNHQQFQAMFKRKAFLFGWMMGGLMDEMEFTEAEYYVQDLIDAYLELQEHPEGEGSTNTNDENESPS